MAVLIAQCLVRLGGTSVVAQDQDRCRDVLFHAAREEFSFESEESLRAEIERFLKMSDEEFRKEASNSEKSGSGTLKLAVKVVSLGLGGGGSKKAQSEQISNIRREFQQDRKEKLSRDEMTRLMVNTVNEKAVEAWSTCMASKNKGFAASVTPFGEDSVELRLAWAPDVDKEVVVDTVKVTSLTLRNLEYDKDRDIDKGTAIGRSPKRQIFTRIDPSKDVLISVMTQGGIFTERVPPKRKPTIDDKGNDIRALREESRSLKAQKDWLEEACKSSKAGTASPGLFPGKIHIIWRPYISQGAGPAEKYAVFRLKEDGTDEKAVGLHLTSREIVDDDPALVPGRPYSYRVVGYMFVGKGPEGAGWGTHRDPEGFINQNAVLVTGVAGQQVK